MAGPHGLSIKHIFIIIKKPWRREGRRDKE
jgi:hypothetical protein